MKKKLNFTFCRLVVPALVSAALLSGCSGKTAAPGGADGEPVQTTAVSSRAGKDKDWGKMEVMAHFSPKFDFVV